MQKTLTPSQSFSQNFRAHCKLFYNSNIKFLGGVGEVFIARNTREYFHLLNCGGGAGLITAGTTLLKFLIHFAKFNFFSETLFAILNYIFSFLLIQLFGFKLATKMPSLWGATLAMKLNDHQLFLETPKKMKKEMIWICRSQFATAMGNLIFVILSSIAFHFIYRILFHKSFLDSPTSLHVLESFHPFESGTLFFASFTGVLLWLSSVFAASAKNYFKKDSIFPLAFNISLGLFLGLTPFLGRILHIPLEVRHFTLSSGALTLAFCSLGSEAGAHLHSFLFSIIGILMIGILNFSVSFFLSLFFPILINHLNYQKMKVLLKDSLHAFLIVPSHFLLPEEQQPVSSSS